MQLCKAGGVMPCKQLKVLISDSLFKIIFAFMNFFSIKIYIVSYLIGSLYLEGTSDREGLSLSVAFNHGTVAGKAQQ